MIVGPVHYFKSRTGWPLLMEPLHKLARLGQGESAAGEAGPGLPASVTVPGQDAHEDACCGLSPPG
jgi:hypothetical protein